MIKKTAPLAEKTIKSILLRLWRDERGGVGDMSEDGDQPPATDADPPPDSPPDPETPAADADPAPPPVKSFLTVDERTDYKTEEAAREGFGKARDRIIEYSQHGTPQEIADRLAELENIKKVAAGQPAGGEPDPYRGMNDQEKSQWQAFEAEDKGKAALKRMGYMRADEVEQKIVDTLERERQIGETRDHFTAESKERGIPITSQGINILEKAAVSVYQQDAEAQRLWDNKDTKGFAGRVFTVLYGEASSSPSPPGNPAPERGADGKFITKAAQYEQVKQAADRLPKAPPNGSAAPTRSADELSPEDRRDPQKRLLRVRQQVKDGTILAGV